MAHEGVGVNWLERFLEWLWPTEPKPEPYCITDSGAKGDDDTDDTAAIQAATRYVFRDAKTGQFISAKRAKRLSEKRTVKERVR